jgi:hypothetical protein
MHSRPGAQHQSAECSIASCVVLVSDDDDDLLSDLSRKDSERVYADNPGGGRL